MTPRTAAAAKDMDREFPNWKLAYRVDEAAAATGMGESTLRRKISLGLLKARKDGQATIILAEDLKAYLASLPELERAA